jgi:hypothetical protein
MAAIHWLALISATLALTAVAMRIGLRAIVQLPVDYLKGASPPPLFELAGALGKVARPLQRVLGLLLIGVGLVASLPGVPGPGLAIALIGLMLAEIPGTHQLTRRLLRRRRLCASVNRLRRRRGKPALLT